MIFQKSAGKVHIYYKHRSVGRPAIAVDVSCSHYTDESNKPLYPFGFGLSYTKFEYADLIIQETDPANIKVNVKLKNSGKLAGEEVAQLYIHDKVASVVRPVMELKGFKKIKLNPGESATLEFILTDKELGFYNNNGDFIVEPGEFEIMVGTSSGDIKLTGKINK